MADDRGRRAAPRAAGDRGCRAGRRRNLARARARRAGNARRPELPRDQERLVRRGRRAADQRRSLRGARGGTAREGHEPCALRARRGRPLHVDRRRLLVPHERRHGGVAARAARERAGDHRRAPAALWERLPRRRSRRSSATGSRCGPGSRPARSTTDTFTTSCSPTARSATSSSHGCAPRASTRTSTTCRCTAPRPGFGSGARTVELPHTDAAAGRLIRLPLWVGMTEADVARVCEAVACGVR